MSTEEILKELEALAEKVNPKSTENKEYLRQLSIAGPVWRHHSVAHRNAFERFHKQITALITRLSTTP